MLATLSVELWDYELVPASCACGLMLTPFDGNLYSEDGRRVVLFAAYCNVDANNFLGGHVERLRHDLITEPMADDDCHTLYPGLCRKQVTP